MFRELLGFHIILALTFTSTLSQKYSGHCALPCVRIEHCQAAQELLLQKNDASRQLLRNAFCKRDAQQEVTLCCEKLLGDLDKHPNQALLPADCGEIKGDRIYGGKEADLQEFPWMVLISYRVHGDLEFQCGGTLINDRYVLTAAHCLANLGSKTIVGVRVGEHNIVTDKDCQRKPPYEICQEHLQDIRIAEVIPHEQFVGTATRLRNDIGLIRLKTRVDLNHKNVGLVCLPRSSSLRAMPMAGANATVTGWGATETGRQSHVLMRVNLAVHDEKRCSDFWNRGSSAGQETVNKLCAGQPGRDSCSGDSGGPLMVSGDYSGRQRFIQQGIVSFGPKSCGSQFPGVYTRVATYMKWILDNIKP